MRAIDAGRLYDQMPSGQSMSRHEFIKQAVILTDPDGYHRDAQSLLTMRSTAQSEKVKIQNALRRQNL